MMHGQTKIKLIGQYGTVGPQYEICLMSPFWWL